MVAGDVVGWESRKRKLWITLVIRMPLFVGLQVLILFVSAGRIDILRVWIYLILICVYVSVSTPILYRFNPELIYQRAHGSRHGTKSWDKFLMPIIVVLPYFQLAVIGLDVGRFRWSTLGANFAVIGVLLYVFASVLMNWAAITNRYFEPTVRIQKERGHQVVTGGPYKIIRHPGYLAGILFPVSITFIIGSVFGLIPAGISAVLITVRTALEDRTLQKELSGYSEYSKRVRYRLLLGVW